VATQHSTSIAPFAAALVELTKSVAELRTETQLGTAEAKHIRESVDELSRKLDGERGLEGRIKSLEIGHARMSFLSHPVFVGLVVVALSGFAGNAFLSWRDLALVQERTLSAEARLNVIAGRTADLDRTVSDLVAKDHYFHGVVKVPGVPYHHVHDRDDD